MRYKMTKIQKRYYDVLFDLIVNLDIDNKTYFKVTEALNDFVEVMTNDVDITRSNLVKSTIESLYNLIKEDLDE